MSRAQAAAVATEASARKRRERLLQRYSAMLQAAGFRVYDQRPNAPTDRTAAEALNDLGDLTETELQRMVGWMVGSAPAAVVQAAQYVKDRRNSEAINA